MNYIQLKKENKTPSAFICETLLGVGGQIPLPPGYLKEVYKHYFNRSNYKEQINLHIGNAEFVLSTLKEKWDLIFVDADKTGYRGYYEMLIDRVKPGTFFLFDNVFFHGEVLKTAMSGKNAKAISAFNEYIKNDSRIEKVMLTIRDGLTLLMKK